jgi:hypothetical protein
MARASILNDVLSTTDSRGIQTESRRVSFSPPSMPPVHEDIFESSPSTSQQETPVKRVQDDDGFESHDDDDTYIKPDVRSFGREKFGEIASPYLTPYMFKTVPR